MPPLLHTQFEDVTIHTAKCDICNKHNKDVIHKCCTCGWFCCTPCWKDRGEDGTHVINEGGRSWTGERVRRVQSSMDSEQLIVEKTVVESRVKKRRRIVVEEESESEEEEEEDDDDEGEYLELPNTGTRKSVRLQRQTGMGDTEGMTSPDIAALADVLLEAAEDRLRSPRSMSSDNDGISNLLRAAAQIENPRHHRSPLVSFSTISGYATDSGDDGQPRSPLFMLEEVDLEPEIIEVDGMLGIPLDVESNELGKMQIDDAEEEIKIGDETLGNTQVGDLQSKGKKASRRGLGVGVIRTKHPVRRRPAKRLRNLYRDSMMVKAPNGKLTSLGHRTTSGR